MRCGGQPPAELGAVGVILVWMERNGEAKNQYGSNLRFSVHRVTMALMRGARAALG
jgi:hypothetical protein